MNPPRWLPTRGQRAARRANDTLHRLAAEILHAVRVDPDRDAPLVRALIEAIDPETGRPLTDDEICHELVLFMLAGHDTTSTTLTYALWSLGHHRDIQERVRAEVAALGERALTPDDVPGLALPCGCCTRRYGCVRPRRGRCARLPATSWWTATWSRPTPWPS